MAIRRYIGHVQTDKVGSEEAARDALFESGVWEWGYNEEAE